MDTSFRVVALPAEKFQSMFSCSDAELRAMGARRIVVEEKPGVPCRVSLADAEVGETVLLLPFVHHDVDSPYRSSGPIFVRSGVETASPARGEIPVMLRHRLLSVRAYDRDAMLVAAVVVKGSDVEGTIGNLFSDKRASYLHIHNAQPGCYNCSVVRA
jgi:hypothetical protein